ncbi:inactive tyrosine-protein kinase 7-like [Babylonia areolata]|uniref:inactive tyrosine-protein kinase 7-like n=1 Tax=Babylonia areolata TaxID=304850 RepID=UPI003FD273A1
MIHWLLHVTAVLWWAGGTSGQLDTFYFSVMPRDQDVVEGRETRIACDVSDRRHIFFQWTQDGRPVRNSTRRFQEDSHLRILRVLRTEDAGLFQCTATNATTRFSLQSNEAKLNIQWIDERADVELKRPKREEVKKGTDVILKCVISGNPDPTILWYHNKFRLFNQEKVKILDEGNRIKLINITETDNGIYSCRAENVGGAVDSTNNFLLNVRVAGTPHLVEGHFTPYLVTQRGSSARLDCPFLGASRIDWFSNYEKLSNSSRHVVYPNGSLYFPKVRAADEGSYRCEGLSRSTASQTFTSELFLASLDEIHRDSFEPRLIPNYPVVIPVHERFQIKVFPPQGRPKPNFWWLGRNDLPIPSSGRIHVTDEGLVFESPQEIDSGNYTFVLNNTAGVKKRGVWVMVSVPPIISRAPQAASVQEDGQVTLSCQVVGTQYPVTTVTWSRDHSPLPTFSPHYQQDTQAGTVTISRARLSDMGHYTCVANTSGHPLVSSSPAFLTVTKRLKFKPLPGDAQLEVDKVGEVECHAEAETPPRVRWLKLGDGGGGGGAGGGAGASGGSGGGGGSGRGRGTGAPRVYSLPAHVKQRGNRLVFDTARREDAGDYTCVATHPRQGVINATIHVSIVECPSITVKSNNVTVFEGHSAVLHCVAKGSPHPDITWYHDSQPILPDARRYTMFKNGTIKIRQVFMEDNGMYACVANNTAGDARWDFFLRVTNDAVEEEEDFNMAKTIIIAVCSAGAYLALVIGLTAFCSYRLLTQCRSHKALPLKTENGDLHREQHELLMKDRDSCTQFRSDSDNRSHAGSALSSHPSHSSQSQQSRSRRPSLDRLHYPRHQLNTLGIMGKGCYGDVFLARAKNPPRGPGVTGTGSAAGGPAGSGGSGTGDAAPGGELLVVVKSLLSKGERESREFYAEVDLFARLDHPNVVRFIGTCREQEPHFLITEYCDWGDLKQFLLATRSDNGRAGRGGRVPALTLTQKVGMAQQVAAGMEALAAQGLVHGDLAARNVLLTSRLQLKVARPALSGDVYASEYYPLHQRMVPLRWLAPEAVSEESAASGWWDVWAFGVFLWEVLQLADLPYRLLSDEEVLRALQLGQAALDAPDGPPPLLSLLQRCTTQQPSQRPPFSEICTLLSLANTDVV